MKLLARMGFIAAAGFIAVTGVAVVRTMALPKYEPGTPPQTAQDYDGGAIAARLGEAIKIKTVSESLSAPTNAAAFEAFAQFLADAYPRAHETLQRERINNHSLLFKWVGENPGQKPVALLAHIDVVPVEEGTQDAWTRPPFSGEIHDGAVWGRGALDNKGQIIAIMEAVENLSALGFKPARDIYFLFGHDEEIGGQGGAGEIAAALKERGVHFAWTLDEGSGLVEDIIPGASGPIALIATAEKGSTTLRFTAQAGGGHSSTPEKDTAVSLVSRAVIAVSDNPYALELDENVVAFLHAIAPQMPFMKRMALANLWLTAPLIKAQLGKSPVTAASLRTTTAPTMINGGAKANILPQRADAVVNYRIHPRDHVDGVIARAENMIDDERISIEKLGGRDPSPQSSTDSEGYLALAEATKEIFGNIPVAPSLTLQATDTRHFTGLADNNYRFTPFIYQPDDLARIHGTDERVKLADLERASAWYEALLRHTGQDGG